MKSLLTSAFLLTAEHQFIVMQFRLGFFEWKKESSVFLQVQETRQEEEKLANSKNPATDNSSYRANIASQVQKSENHKAGHSSCSTEDFSNQPH